MRRPDPKLFAFVALTLASTTAFNANAGTRTEYRYPDRPDIVFTETGAQRATDPSRPMAFASFESAISASDARSMTGNRSASLYSELPQRVEAPKPSYRNALVSEPVVTKQAYTPTTQRYEPAPVSGAYAIQAGAFSSAANAQRMAAELSSIGYTRVSEGSSNGRTVFRVYIDGFSSKAQAQPALSQMKSRGYDGFVTRAS